MKKIKNLVVVFLFSFLVIHLASSNWNYDTVETTIGGISCNASDYYAAWMNNTFTGASLDTLVYNASENQPGNCSKFYPETNSTCCPPGFNCEASSGDCVKMNQCSNYTTLPSCLEANEVSSENEITWQQTPAYFFFKDNIKNNVYKDIYELKCKNWNEGSTYINGGLRCQNFSRCECYWYGGNCHPTSVDGVSCPNQGGKGITTGVRCVTKAEGEPRNLCDSIGKIIQNYTAIALDTNDTPLESPQDHGCTASPIETPCSAVKIVPFFTFKNLLIAVLGIGMFYFFTKRE